MRSASTERVGPAVVVSTSAQAVACLAGSSAARSARVRANVGVVESERL